MPVRYEVTTYETRKAIVTISKSDFATHKKIDLYGAMGISIAFVAILYLSMNIAKAARVEVLSLYFPTGSAMNFFMTIGILLGSIGVGMFCLFKISRRLDKLGDDIARRYGWDEGTPYEFEVEDSSK